MNGPAVTHLSAAHMNEAFAEGRPVLRAEGYQVHASRRTEPGVAEVHRIDVDVFHILDGSATIITGGTVVDPKSLDKNETRGRAIEGGTPQRLAKGDVLVIPAGVPHWFQKVDGPLVYFTVKVTNRQP